MAQHRQNFTQSSLDIGFSECSSILFPVLDVIGWNLNGANLILLTSDLLIRESVPLRSDHRTGA